MKRLSEYEVLFSELKEYKETFEFHLGNRFFEVFQSDLWSTGDLTVVAEATKRADGITFDFTLKGILEIMCDRCLDFYAQHIDFSQTLFVKFGEEAGEMDDNILIVPRDDNKVDFSQLFYEYLVLSLPVKRVHPEKADGSTDCNKEMIEKLENHIVSEENEETDPRWDDLKKLFDKN